MRLGVPAAASMTVALIAPAALAGGDPYSPAASPPPAAFYGGYAAGGPTSSFVPRSPTLRAIGIALVVAGGLTLVSAPLVGATSASPGGDPTKPSGSDGVVLGLALGGLGLLGAGIPLAVYGSTPVPPSRPRAVRIEPTANGLRVVF